DHLATGRAAPADAAGLRVEGVDVAVEGADVDGRRAVHRARNNWCRGAVAAGRVGPGEFAVRHVEAVDAVVVVARVDAAEGDRRGRVELAAADPRAQRPGRPDQLSRVGVDG